MLAAIKHLPRLRRQVHKNQLVLHICDGDLIDLRRDLHRHDAREVHSRDVLGSFDLIRVQDDQSFAAFRVADGDDAPAVVQPPRETIPAGVRLSELLHWTVPVAHRRDLTARRQR